MRYFLSKATLRPGRYSYEDKLHMALLPFDTIDERKEYETLPDFPERKVIRFFQKKAEKEATERRKMLSGEKPFPRSHFEFKQEYLKLLRHANIGWKELELSAIITLGGKVISEKLNPSVTIEYKRGTKEIFPVPAIDPKRPYGHTDVYQDMADILGMEGEGDELLNPDNPEDKRRYFSEEQIDVFDSLHSEMQEALQVFLKYAQIPASP